MPILTDTTTIARARKFSLALLAGYRKLARHSDRADSRLARAGMLLSEKAAAEYEDRIEMEVEHILDRNRKLEAAFIRLILRASKWAPGPVQLGPEEWPQPAVNVDGILWVVLIGGFKSFPGNKTRRTSLVRVDLTTTPALLWTA